MKANALASWVLTGKLANPSHVGESQTDPPCSAGKSTTINMLCGYLRPTKGYALIRGLDIRSQMDEIHLQMGKFNTSGLLFVLT